MQSDWIVLDMVVLVSCAFILLACVCRLRFGTGHELSVLWALIYLAVAAAALLMTLGALAGESRCIDAILSATVAVYIAATAPSWRSEVPPVAKPKRDTP